MTVEKKAVAVEKKTIRSDIPGHHAYLSSASHGGDNTRRLVVGGDISLNGDIGACDHLVVEGAVNAPGFSARRLDVTEAGLFSGCAEVQQAVIAGRFEGQLKVTGRLTVKSTARITGDIAYGIIEAEAGARIEGGLSVLPAIEAPAAVALPKALPHPSANVEKLFVRDRTAVREDHSTVFRRVQG